jgi:sugar phosphate isomerase/epimerase
METVVVHDIEDQIGISTHSLPGVTLEEAIDSVRNGGFNTFELVPATYQGVVGSPRIPNAGLWPRGYTTEQRRELKDRLSCFKYVTVHFPHMEINIASRNPGIREESQRQYTECLQLAADLGVKTATFHSGHHTGSFIGNEEEIYCYNIEFCRGAMQLAHQHGMRLGFENQWTIEVMRHLLDSVGDKDFGINIDLGDTISDGDRLGDMDGLFEWVDAFKGRIWEFHVAGCFASHHGFLDHQNFNRNNVIDYRAVMAKIKEIGYVGPMIFEIQSKDVPTVIADCQEAKAELLRYWAEL